MIFPGVYGTGRYVRSLSCGITTLIGMIVWMTNQMANTQHCLLTLLVSLMLDGSGIYVVVSEYPIAQSSCRHQLSLRALRICIVSKWIPSPTFKSIHKRSIGQEVDLIWARGVLGPSPYCSVASNFVALRWLMAVNCAVWFPLSVFQCWNRTGS